MFCPFCGAQETRVIDSRLSNDGSQVRRRRECLQCKERFTTHETVEFNMPRVVKSDGNREPFKEEKLRAGFLRALERRPVVIDKIETAINQIRKKIMARGEREVTSREIGEAVMCELRNLDHVAYVRFASVYRSFQDVEEFNDVIEGLKEAEPTGE
ncbi:MAG: transcriptional regulator NrdR [Gammaproteobacteria bacterium]|nr:MAG: transcriptional regulator NrdR [Gammaproteobacteria bacterium]RLA24641.1 MAG: transcriptional regulator NrdR [Gammaproteobacteria bacterium]